MIFSQSRQLQENPWHGGHTELLLHTCTGARSQELALVGLPKTQPQAREHKFALEVSAKMRSQSSTRSRSMKNQVTQNLLRERRFALAGRDVPFLERGLKKRRVAQKSPGKPYLFVAPTFRGL